MWLYCKEHMKAKRSVMKILVRVKKWSERTTFSYPNLVWGWDQIWPSLIKNGVV